jgi:hypothetical protein
MSQNSSIIAAIEATRSSLIDFVNGACDGLVAKLAPQPVSPNNVTYKMPTLADGHDPRNKIGLNLTPRGVEILYRVFDDDGGYNRAAKMLNISQGAAKNRKGLWQKLGGKNRIKEVLDIDDA